MGRKHSGFTLVEIMIVVAIVALLASIAVVPILRSRTTSQETTVIGNLRALASALEMYRSVNQAYPALNTWMAGMYGADCAIATDPDPDFGPPAFCASMDASAIGQYLYTYVGPAAPAQTYTLLAVSSVLGTSGTRSFLIDQTGLTRHCTGSGTAADLSDESTVDLSPTACD